jgi:NAD-dependent SIR2 family protein deacetylase
MKSDANRRRYWARSFVGWQGFANVPTNGAHEGLARLQANGWVSNILTQNVDRLHCKAGARHVLEIHGTTHECALGAFKLIKRQNTGRLHDQVASLVLAHMGSGGFVMHVSCDDWQSTPVHDIKQSQAPQTAR